MSLSTFNAFKNRNYRLFFGGQSVSLIGTWMQKTAVSWVVYAETHSNLMLGITLFASMFPTFLFSFLGGVVADRYDRYKLLLLTQIASMIQAILITVIILSGFGNIWVIIGLSAILGIINAFDVPARQSLIYDLIKDKKDLPNALALNSSMVNLSRLIGPGLAGLALEQFGDGLCFGLNAVSFVAVIASLLLMKLPAFQKKQVNKNIFLEMKEGISYIKHTPVIGFIILMLASTSLFVLPFASLIPVYAKDIFKGTASTFGVIDSVIGLGAFCGALFLASLKPERNLMKVLAINTFVFGVGLALFSHATFYPAALIFAAVSGVGMLSQVTLSNTIIQTTVDPAMRGRVISIYAMAYFGMQPLGGLLIGFVSEKIGTQDTVLIQGIITLAISATVFYFYNKSKKALTAHSKELALQD